MCRRASRKAVTRPVPCLGRHFLPETAGICAGNHITETHTAPNGSVGIVAFEWWATPNFLPNLPRSGIRYSFEVVGW
jgi:hypothetical protein